MIIDTIKSLLEASTYITNVNIDYTENTIGNFGLYNTGNALVSESITGIKTYRSNYVLYFFSNSEDDLNRINNTNLIQKICDYLEKQENIEITGENGENGVICSFVCSNGMLFNVPGSIYEGYTYQIQIQVTYKIFP